MKNFTMPKHLVRPALTAVAVGTLLLGGCSATPATTSAPAASATATSTTTDTRTTASTSAESSDAGTLTGDLGTGVTDFLADNKTSHADSDDGDYDESTATRITLGSEDVNITEPGTYILSGTATDASVLVDSAADGKVVLVLEGATLSSSVSSPIVVTAADEVVIVLADGTTNTITDTSPAADPNDSDAPDAAIFSMADLTIAGTGTLDLTSRNNDGIASKDGLVVLSGDLDITAGDDGLRGKDYLIVQSGTIDVTAAEDGLKSTNEDDDTVGYVYIMDGSVTVAAGDDGVHAEGDLLVAGGTLDITESYEGLEGANIVIAGGDSSVTSADDGLNATSGTSTDSGGPGMGGEPSDGSRLVITAGRLQVDAAGDGLDSNGTITMTGGEVVVNGPTDNGNAALDTTSFDISGGTLVAAGSAGMAMTPSASSAQGWLSINQNLSAGQTLEVSDGSTVLASFTATKNAASIIVSAPGIATSGSYQYTVDGTSSGTVTANTGAGNGMGGPGDMGGPGGMAGGGPA